MNHSHENAELSGAPSRSRTRGLSLVELLLTVVVVSVLATISVIAVTQVSEKAQARKLDSDVATLNSAIRIYLANGGNLDAASTPAEVLARLKSSRRKADKETHVGAPSGRMIDRRVISVGVPAGSWRARANYSPVSKRFEVVSGVAGVEFRVDDSLAESATDLETRDDTVTFAKNSRWIWDHASTANPSGPGGPSSIPTDTDPEDSDPEAPEPEPEPEPPGPGGGGGGGEDPTPSPPRLPRPQFSKSSGPHPENEFPLSITIQNVPPAADAEAEYKIDNGSWETYSGALTIPMNTTLRARFLARDADAYRKSRTAYAYYYPVPESLSGNTDGNFHSPQGGPNLVYEITPDGNRFTHGDPVYVLDGTPVDSGTPNILEFQAKSFSNVAPGATFKLGDFTYSNGNSYYDSHATSVQLEIVIEMPDRGKSVSFDLNLDLVNTSNDPDDPEASADYVKIVNLNQNIDLTINEVAYRLDLEFGATDSFGFATKNSFHVYEGASGHGELLATFRPR